MTNESRTVNFTQLSARAMTTERKATPIYSGVLQYFPNALLAVAQVSHIGSQQHNPGKPMHYDSTKSKDHADALMHHLIDDARGEPFDTDGTLHLAKVAWRALAMLEARLLELQAQEEPSAL